MTDYSDNFELTSGFFEQAKVPDLTPLPVVLDEVELRNVAQELRDAQELEFTDGQTQQVTIDNDAYLSAEAHAHNKELVRSKSMGFVDTGSLVVAIVAHRPTPEQLHYRAHQSEIDVAVKVSKKLATSLPNLFAFMTTALSKENWPVRQEPRVHITHPHSRQYEQTHKQHATSISSAQ